MTTSIFGAIFHNIGQVIAVSIIVKNMSTLKLIPAYILVGLFTGSIIGIITDIMYKKIVLIMFDKNI